MKTNLPTNLLVLGLCLAGSVYAVNHFRRPGAMTPVEAQAMEMTLPAPAGIAPVELEIVERGTIGSTVRYTGQTVGYTEQEIAPRVTGTLLSMPLYAGDKVRKGQVVARLDTSQSAPQVAAQRAALNNAVQATEVARRDEEQSQTLVAEAHAELGTKRGALASARADLKATQEERDNAQSQLEAAQSMISDAGASLQAAQADFRYWQEEIKREGDLLKAGAVTQEEFQREKAQADNAAAKVQGAQARITQVEAQKRSAQSNLRKAAAMIASSEAKITQAQSELESHRAHVLSTQAAVRSAKQKIVGAQAGEAQMQAMLSGVSATQGYSEIQAETDGVVVQRMVSPGVLVSPGQTLLKIAQITPLRVQANVAETDLTRVEVGGRVQIIVGNGAANRAPIIAKISSITPALDPASRMGIVEAILPNRDNRLFPGQSVSMDISLGQSQNALIVPTRSLRYHTIPTGGTLSSQSTTTVWLAEPITGQSGQYAVREVTVKTGISDRTRTEITEGLEAGQKIVLAGQDNLKNGDTVARSESDGEAMKPSPPTKGSGMSGMSGKERNAPPEESARPSPSVSPSVAPAKTIYTCLMHPEIEQDHPGDCPKCHMTLVPKRKGGAR